MKKESIELLLMLLDDVESQANALKERDDLYWSAYEIDNWQSMADNIKKIFENEEIFS
jgi:hypothetical protein